VYCFCFKSRKILAIFLNFNVFCPDYISLKALIWLYAKQRRAITV
jgi:hypothetical protein